MSVFFGVCLFEDTHFQAGLVLHCLPLGGSSARAEWEVIIESQGLTIFVDRSVTSTFL